MTSQPLLFEIHPEGTEPPVSERPIKTGCLLPLPANQTIDTRRVGDILNINVGAVHGLLKQGYITGYQLNDTMPWRISYQSVVDFCDSLRIRFHIADRRPKLAPGRRWRDDELLPFPKADTVAIKEVMTGLDTTKEIALQLVEEGTLEAYRIGTAGWWRVSKTSLFKYRDRMRSEVESSIKSSRSRILKDLGK